MRKIVAHGMAVLLLLSAFILVPCTEPVLAQTDDEPLAEEEMSFEDFDEGLDSLGMEEEVSDAAAETAPDEEALPMEEEAGMEGLLEPEVLPEVDPFAEAEPMEEAGVDEFAEDEEADWGISGDEAMDEDPFVEAEPMEETAEETAPTDEPEMADEPAPAMAEEDFKIESTVDEIESIETEQVVFDHSGEVIALALKLKAAEAEIERLRAGVEDSDQSLVDELRDQLESTHREVEQLKRDMRRDDSGARQAGKVASLRGELKHSEKEKRALRAQVQQIAAQLQAARARGEKSGDLEKAEKEIERLRDLIKRIWQANRREKLNMHYNMAAAYRAGGMLEKAESHYMKALAIDPEDPGVHYNLAILYDDELKNKRKAREHYEKFLELAPDDKDAAKVVEWMATMD